MIFGGNTRSNNEIFTLNGDIVEIVKEFKYRIVHPKWQIRSKYQTAFKSCVQSDVPLTKKNSQNANDKILV